MAGIASTTITRQVIFAASTRVIQTVDLQVVRGVQEARRMIPADLPATVRVTPSQRRPSMSDAVQAPITESWACSITATQSSRWVLPAIG